MEPVTILAITNASLGIVRSLVHTIKELYEIAEALETAALGIRTVATQCNSFRVAVDRIYKWLLTQNESSKYDLDEDFWQALKSNLDTGQLVLDDLEHRIQGLKKNPTKFWTRTKYLWNQVVISELQSQIQGLMAALSILIQVIDIPTTGGKRSQSRAQSQRLNGLTVSNRRRVCQGQQREREAQQDLLDSTDTHQITEPGATTAPNDVLSQHTSPSLDSDELSRALSVNTERNAQQSFPDTAPPPYEFYGKQMTSSPVNDVKTNSGTQSTEQLAEREDKVQPNEPTPESEADQSSSRFSAGGSSKENAVENKTKRPIWQKFMKRSSKKDDKEELTRTRSNPTNSEQGAKLPSNPIPSNADSGNHFQRDHAATERQTRHPNDLELHQAMSGLEVDSSPATKVESAPQSLKLPQPNNHEDSGTTALETGSTMDTPIIATPSEDRSQSSDRYRALRLEQQTQSDTDFHTIASAQKMPDYSRWSGATRTDSSDYFQRMRPAQRVYEAKERSSSGGSLLLRQNTSSPPPQALERQSTNGSILGGLNSSSTADRFQQNWKTTAVTNRPIKLKVQFETESFTNKISSPAAKALGVEEFIVEYLGAPITHLTLLYTVSDGHSTEANTVLGDEAEFVVMHEEESRTPLLVLGAAFTHLAQIMEQGEYVYWNPGSVPEKLRNMDRLRMFRRFELVRW